MEKTIRIAGRIKHSSVNGPGVRYVLFFQGCPHHCIECQNPETWDPKGGEELPVEEIIREIQDTRYLDGLTLSGGEPFMQAEEAARIASACKETGKSVWCYTGYTFEELIQEKVPKAEELLKTIDVLVDGEFKKEEADDSLLYRGSRNQRLIDVSLSLINKCPQFFQEE